MDVSLHVFYLKGFKVELGHKLSLYLSIPISPLRGISSIFEPVNQETMLFPKFNEHNYRKIRLIQICLEVCKYTTNECISDKNLYHNPNTFLYVNTHHQCKRQQDQSTEFVLKRRDVKKGFVTIHTPSLSTFESDT